MNAVPLFQGSILPVHQLFNLKSVYVVSFATLLINDVRRFIFLVVFLGFVPLLVDIFLGFFPLQYPWIWIFSSLSLFHLEMTGWNFFDLDLKQWWKKFKVSFCVKNYPRTKNCELFSTPFDILFHNFHDTIAIHTTQC